jgi:hypothetical protein
MNESGAVQLVSLAEFATIKNSGRNRAFAVSGPFLVGGEGPAKYDHADFSGLARLVLR